jgi:hypothetical protein
VLVAVSLTFVTWPTDITIDGVSAGYRTVSRSFDTTNVHVRWPTVEITNVALADKVTRAFLIAVAVSDILFTGATQRTEIVMARCDRTFFFAVAVDRCETNICLVRKSKQAAGIVDTEESCCTLVVAVTIALFLLAGPTDSTVVWAPLVKRAISFIHSHTDVNLRIEAKACSYIIDARQAFLAFIVSVAVALSFNARATLGAVVFVPRLKWTCKFFLHAYIHIPPPVECGSHIVQTKQVAGTLFIAVTIALACFTRSADRTVVIVPFINRAGISSIDTYINKWVQLKRAPVVTPANEPTLALTVRIAIAFALAARTADQAEIIIAVFKGAVCRTGCNRRSSAVRCNPGRAQNWAPFGSVQFNGA